jgi:hypothetical protein
MAWVLATSGNDLIDSNAATRALILARFEAREINGNLSAAIKRALDLRQMGVAA